MSAETPLLIQKVYCWTAHMYSTLYSPYIPRALDSVPRAAPFHVWYSVLSFSLYLDTLAAFPFLQPISSPPSAPSSHASSPAQTHLHLLCLQPGPKAMALICISNVSYSGLLSQNLKWYCAMCLPQERQTQSGNLACLSSCQTGSNLSLHSS